MITVCIPESGEKLEISTVVSVLLLGKLKAMTANSVLDTVPSLGVYSRIWADASCVYLADGFQKTHVQ